MAKLRHLAIISTDPGKLAKFYADVFDMEIIHRSESGGVFLTDGTINLALLPNKAEGKPSGINHFGFHIEDADEITGRLAEWDIGAPVQRPKNRPYAETRTTDPDGNNIDLSVHGFQDVETKAHRDKKKSAPKLGPKLEKVEG
jgi:catechol 2,3-dioxygenase-like lactoylglutathione lyase family enzyme